MKKLLLAILMSCILFLVGCNLKKTDNISVDSQDNQLKIENNNEKIEMNDNKSDKLFSMAESGDEKESKYSFFVSDSVHQNTPGGYGSGMPDSYYFLSNNTYFWDAGDYYDPMSRVRAKAGTWKIENTDDSDSNIKGKIILNEKYELYLDGGEIGEVDVPGGGTENGLVNYNLSLKEVNNAVSETIEYIGVSQYSLDVGNAESPAYEYKFGDKVMYSNVTKIEKTITDFVKEDFYVSSEKWVDKLLELMSKNNQIKIGKYVISYDINYPTEEEKQNAVIYYDDLAITLYENNEFKLYFGEGYDIKGKYVLTNDILNCKSEKLSMYNHSESEDLIYDIVTEFEFKILDVNNIRLEKIINPDYTYGSFIDTVNVPGNIYTYNEKVENKKLFYFVGSSLIAIGENGIIRPVDERLQANITYRELLSEEFYTTYSLKSGITRKLDKVKLGIYVDEDYVANGIESVLISYGKRVGSGEGYLSELKYDIYELDLPVNGPNELFEMDAYYEIGKNGYGYLIELDTYDNFVTNANFNINFEQKSEDIELSDRIIVKIKEYIKNNGLANDVPYFCSNKFVTDLDGDNKEEKVYAIETKIFNGEEFDSNVSRTGALSLILIERENEEVEIMFDSNIKPFEYTPDLFWNNIYGYINELQLFIADIDNDKDKEIIMDAIIIEPEGGEMLKTYSINNAIYEEVGTSYYGCGH